MTILKTFHRTIVLATATSTTHPADSAARDRRGHFCSLVGGIWAPSQGGIVIARRQRFVLCEHQGDYPPAVGRRLQRPGEKSRQRSSGRRKETARQRLSETRPHPKATLVKVRYPNFRADLAAFPGGSARHRNSPESVFELRLPGFVLNQDAKAHSVRSIRK